MSKKVKEVKTNKQSNEEVKDTKQLDKNPKNTTSIEKANDSKPAKVKDAKVKDTKAKSKDKKDNKKKQGKVSKYFKDLKSELKKVVWPSKKKVANNTSVVLVSIVLMAVFVGLLDTGLFKLLQFVISLGAE